jgi:uncharacterized protein
MSDQQRSNSRRNFLKTLGAAAGGSLLASGGVLAQAGPEADTNKTVGTSSREMPQRPFGKTGVRVPILSLGGMFDIPSNQMILKMALQKGVTHWDTATSYSGGQSERGIGMFFESYPERRKEVFLVTKSGDRYEQGLTRDLEKSLERMKTDYVDLFFVHGLKSIDEMTAEKKAWGERMKKEGKIRFFGFSTHTNIEDCLLGASKLGWIDGIMMTYNFRLMEEDKMRRAVDACHEANIGLTAMKTQGGGPIRSYLKRALDKLAISMGNKELTEFQVKLKAVWENEQIANVCSQMPNLTILAANIEAATDMAHLSRAEHDLLRQYAAESNAEYCAGCAERCERAVGGAAPIGDVMRCLMYYHNYEDRLRAVEEFNRIPGHQRRMLARLDFAPAERRCPRALPIQRLMAEADRLLARTG